MSSKKEPIHLCPICICIEMEFVERIANTTSMRTRRFKCPVCNHSEMYLMGGPHDADRQQDRLRTAKLKKETEYKKRHNLL